MNLISSTVTSLKDKLLSLPKSIFRVVIGTTIALVIGVIFFIVRDGLHLFGLAKDKITK